MDQPKDSYSHAAPIDVAIRNLTMNGTSCDVKVQGIYMRMPETPNPKYADQTKLSHKDKLCGYVQTSGQLGGALGLVASGLLEGNFARIGLGSFNAFRSSTKLVSDFNAKSKSKSHRNDMAEGAVATTGNSVGLLNVRSGEELMAVCMGVTAWATKGVMSFIHMRREDNAEKRQEEIKRNNLFFNNVAVQPKGDAPPPRVQGFIHRNLDALKEKALEGTFMIMAHAPPLMMAVRAASYLIDGINNNDLAMAGGGASFIVGATLMAIKDHRSYMTARAERKEEKGLKEKAKEDFGQAKQGASLTFIAEIDSKGHVSARWGLEQFKMDAIIEPRLEDQTAAYNFNAEYKTV